MFQPLSSDVLRAHKGKSFVGVTTCFFCHDGAGNFLMTLRSQNARDEQGAWETGGGGLKFGVPVLDNLAREMKEEVNATAKQIDFLGYRDVRRSTPEGDATHWVALDFAVLVDPAEVRINEPDMIEDLGWFQLKTLPQPLHSQQQPFFEKYAPQLASFFIV